MSMDSLDDARTTAFGCSVHRRYSDGGAVALDVNGPALPIDFDSSDVTRIDSLFDEMRAAVTQAQPAQTMAYLYRYLGQRLASNTQSTSQTQTPSTPQSNPQSSANPIPKGSPSSRSSAQPQALAAAPVDLQSLGHSFGCDIGGSLCKIAFLETDSSESVQNERDFIVNSTRYGSTGVRDPLLSIQCTPTCRLHFLNFETRRMESALSMMKQNKLMDQSKQIAALKGEKAKLMATGGGAFKYSDTVASLLDVKLCKKDELSCLLVGLNFLLDHVPDECYYLPDFTHPQILSSTPLSPIYPYLLVNIGSGVSILRVDSENRYERVSGTCIGGGTFWGLCRLLTQCKDFEEAMEISQTGNPSMCDMLVGDIYGGSYDKFGLNASVCASAFGKLVMKDAIRRDETHSTSDLSESSSPTVDSVKQQETLRQGIADADIARALLNMVGHNIAQLAYLVASQQKVNRVLFCGNFLRRNNVSMASLSLAIDYWSRGEMKALFLKHEGYCGALGALLLQNELDEDE